MDDADKASDQEQMAIKAAIKSVRWHSKPLPALGCCYYCSEPLKGGERFCDTDCRDDYERQEKSKARNGRV